MDFTFDDISIKTLPQSDVEKVQALFEDSADFSMLVEGRLPRSSDAEEMMQAVPEGKNLSDKSVLGIYQEENLIGVLDVVRDHPLKDTWFIGLLLINPKFRNKGLGAKIYLNLKDKVRQEGALSIMISVAEQNIQALKFWKNLGFIELHKNRS